MERIMTSKITRYLIKETLKKIITKTRFKSNMNASVLTAVYKASVSVIMQKTRCV